MRDGGTGYYGNAVVNVPLGDAVALRASGFYRRTAGYIDAIGIADDDVNRARSYGGRASLLLKPSDRLSLRLTAVLQNIEVDSRNAFDADAATLRPITADPFTGASTGGREVRYQLFPDRNEVSYRLYTGTLDYDLGFASFTSVTSYSRQVATDRSDVSYNDLGGITLAQYASSAIYGLAPDAYGIYYPNRSTQKKFTQELRLASNGSATLEWLVGGYYTREPGQLYQRYYPFDNATGRPITPVPVPRSSDAARPARRRRAWGGCPHRPGVVWPGNTGPGAPGQAGGAPTTSSMNPP